MISLKLKNYIKENENLIQINPTDFLIKVEKDIHYFSIKDIVQFINIFYEAGIEFDINKLFNSKVYNFTDKYFKKGSTPKEIENLFNDVIMKDPVLNQIETEIPKKMYENLNNNEINQAIKNAMICTKIGIIQGQVEKIDLQIMFDWSYNGIYLGVIVKSEQDAFYQYFDIFGALIPNYGFAINKKGLFEAVNKIRENLISSLKITHLYSME